MSRRTGSSRFVSFPGVLVGLLLFGNASAQPGMVLSSQKISNTQGNFTATLHNLDEMLGAAACLGDLDGPGPAATAVAFGALDDDGGTDAGAVYVAFLAANGAVLSHQKISDSVISGKPLKMLDQFGSAVAFLGDLDGNGPSAAAIAVGAVGDGDGGSDCGAVYVLYLSTAGNVLSWHKISDTSGLVGGPLDAADEFGGAIASLGDLDGPGPSAHAIAVGAIGDDDGGTDVGAVYILLLDGSGAVSTWRKVSDLNLPGAPLDAGDDFGTSVTSLGDLDGAGPGVLAIAVGAALDDDGGSDRGAAHVLFLDATGSVLSAQKISDTQGNFTDFFSDGDEFGGALANLGDLDGPGGSVTALAVGVAADDDGGEDRGAVHVLFLNGDGTCSSSQKISDFYGNFTVPLENLDNFGSSLAVLGDLDGPGPGTVAVLVGATGDDDGGTDRGGGYVLFLDGFHYILGVSPSPGTATTSALGRPSPNPFSPATAIPFRLDREANARIDIWDLKGRRVRLLVRARMPAGDHQVSWDGRDDQGRKLPNGTYFLRMAINDRPVPGAGKALLLR